MAKANKKAWILKYMANKYNIPQKTLLIMYETIIVPIITYGIEIWGDVCITHFKKLESVEHSCITKILGVNRLAHKTDTMYEAKMIPLKYRHDLKMLRTFKSKELEDEIAYDIGKRKKNFMKRLTELLEILNLNKTDIKGKKDKELKKIIKTYWLFRLNNEEKEDQRSIFTKSLGKKEMKYEQLSKNSKDNSIWHQARLGVLPTKDFLFSIRKSENKMCTKEKKYLR